MRPPALQRALSAALCGLVVLVILSCAARASAVVSTAAQPAAERRLAGCDVTHPNGRTPPGEHASDWFHGKHGLWTSLPLDGVLRITTNAPVATGETFGTIYRDGSLSTKFPWWGSRSAATKLKIRGTRLDGNARRLRLTVKPGGKGDSPHFWPSRLRFTTAGCWQIKARSGHAHLNFTVSVQRVET